MTGKRSGPPRSSHRAAQDVSAHTDHRPDGDSPQFKPTPTAEARLVSAGWRDPAEVARVADAAALHVSDFSSRLCGVVCGYIRIVGERGQLPTIDGALAILSGLATSERELTPLLETPIPSGESIADLVTAVVRGAAERSEADARYATQCGLREVVEFVVAMPNWRDELRDFRSFTKRMKRSVARAYRSVRPKVVWHV